jgi:hypothetical protein
MGSASGLTMGVGASIGAAWSSGTSHAVRVGGRVDSKPFVDGPQLDGDPATEEGRGGAHGDDDGAREGGGGRDVHRDLR